MSATILSIDEIVSDPKIRSGRPVIRGTGFKVSDVIVYHFHNGYSLEEIAEYFIVSLAQVHAALAYYYLHEDEIEEELRRDTEDAARLIEELERQGKLKRYE